MTSAAVEAIAFVRTNCSSDPRPDIQFMIMPIGFSTDCGTFLFKAAGISDRVSHKIIIIKYKLKYNSFMMVLFQLTEKYLYPMCGQGTASIFTVLLRPYSHGELSLKSKNPLDHPVINPKYLHDERDLKTLVEGKLNK
jgi:hypothetical protein